MSDDASALTKARARLRARYVASFAEKIAEIEAARAALAAGDEGAVIQARRHAHRLRGSGASYGFPALSDAAGEVEDAAEGDLDGALARLIDALRELSRSSPPSSSSA